jgi:hypothetical protein
VVQCEWLEDACSGARTISNNSLETTTHPRFGQPSYCYFHIVPWCRQRKSEYQISSVFIEPPTIFRNIALSVRVLGYIFKEACNPQKSISPLLTVLLHFVELSLPFKISPKLSLPIHSICKFKFTRQRQINKAEKA